jgi:hypothetical protein
VNRLLLLPAALLLALYAVCVAFESTHLTHTGAWTLTVSAAILAAAAVGLMARQPWAYAFAVLIVGLTALACVSLAAIGGRDVLGGSGHGEWAGVRAVMVGGASLVALAAALAAMVALVLLGLGRRGAGAHSAATWVLSCIGALVALGVLGWLLVGVYWRRQLPTQNRCLSGDGASCERLAHDSRRFTKPERLTFARLGCEAGHDGSCGSLASLLETTHTEGSAEVRTLAVRCQAGEPHICQKLGAHLLAIGDDTNGARYLTESCTLGARWCSSAAQEAEERGRAGLSRELLEKGCGAEDAQSCRALLRQARKTLGPDELSALELRSCLVGDVNDCRPLMSRDLHGVCAEICQGTTESRMHTCTYCARDAEAAGEPDLARAWYAGNCERGYAWSCTELERLRKPRGAAKRDVN